jgi:GAF domain-containing protein
LTNELRFLSQVADLIALAFDNALNFAALRRASEELRGKNDRLQLLLDVTNQVVSNLQLRELMRAISQDIQRAMQCDFASLSLADAEERQLRQYSLDFPEGKGIFPEELVYPVDGTPSGTAFRTMKPVTMNRVLLSSTSVRPSQIRINAFVQGAFTSRCQDGCEPNDRDRCNIVGWAESVEMRNPGHEDGRHSTEHSVRNVVRERNAGEAHRIRKCVDHNKWSQHRAAGSDASEHVEWH